MLSGPICAMVWEGRDAVKTGRGTYNIPLSKATHPSTVLFKPPPPKKKGKTLTVHLQQSSSAPPTPWPPPLAPSVVTSPSMSAATSATAPTLSRTPRRRLLSGSRRVRSSATRLPSSTGSTRRPKFLLPIHNPFTKRNSPSFVPSQVQCATHNLSHRAR